MHKGYNNSRYHYCSYWRTWSRVLGMLPTGGVVELNLSPIHNQEFSDCRSGWRKEVGEIVIRKHGTSPDFGDKFQDFIDPTLLSQMNENLGETLTIRLLTEDFLAQIDWDKYSKVSNGGARLEDCRL